jgi:two-component system NtrC family sensor kinase
MKHFLSSLLGGRLQKLLIAAFALIAGLTVGLSSWGTSRVIQEYLSRAESEVVKRDMNLAKAFYQLKLDEVAAISHRLALDPWVIRSFQAASRRDPEALQVIDHQIINKITVLALGGTHLIAILDPRGKIIVGRVLTQSGTVSTPVTAGDWGELPIVKEVLESATPKAATEVIPVEFLAQVGLDQQAYIPLIETRLAAPKPFDPREGTAGFTLTGVHPIRSPEGKLLGAAVSVYLFNNDFTLVDRIKEVAGIDTVTLFFGDLRVATNVLTEEGKRAVGTRIAETVGEVVLHQGRDYIGRAYVVKEWFITWYTPLFDGRGKVVGSLYVGARESAFLQLVHNFNERVFLIALVCILLAGVVAVPISRFITQPIDRLVQAHRRLAEGDMRVRVQIPGSGELALLGRSFNTMVETLERTQKELLHKEKLASMGQLAAGVAHEINNPLGAILLYAGMLHEGMSDGDPRREDVKMIMDETHRCKKIVSDLLNFSRQQEILAQDCHLNEILEQVIGSLSHQPFFQNVRIIRNFAADLPVIQADPAQLTQVFVNLFNNAAEAMPEGGTITVGTRALDAQRVEVTISDTGCGISEENLGKLFTPFFTTKPIGKGTGLGLSIVYGIIKMHRGQISVQSQVGKGTTFAVTLPVQLLAVSTAGTEAPSEGVIG